MKAAVLGAGSWGTALAHVLAVNGHDVDIWGRSTDVIETINRDHVNPKYLAEASLHSSVHATQDIVDAIRDAQMIVLSLPSRALPDFFKYLPCEMPRSATLVHAVKGLVRPANVRVSTFLASQSAVTGCQLAVLSGPSHAEEVVRGLPTTVVVASDSRGTAEFVQDSFMNPSFRVYGQSDVIGVELGGTLKNIIALGVGLTEGLGLGDNAKAALMTRGLAEITRLGVALGASPLTFSGLSGIGDLIVTCTSMHSRNYRTGRLLATGMPLSAALEAVGMAVEGVGTTYAAYELAGQVGIDMPITVALRRVLESEIDPKAAVQSLMERKKNHEMEDVGEHLRTQDWSQR